MIRPFLHPFPRVFRSSSERRLSGFRIFGLPASARSRSGSALVIVLGLLSVLMLMGVAFSVTMRTERGGASNMRHAAMARHTLDSAIARTMSDLDAELRAAASDGHDVPEEMVILVSGEGQKTTPVNLLSHEIARHLPSDQLAAALYTQAHWLPIYGDVRVSDAADDDPTAEDSPVGRYAYVVLNGCGYLDPNVVGVEDRNFGLTPDEIYPGDISKTSGKLLEIKENGTVGAFLTQRDKDGHYVTMRDFFRKSVTNIVRNARFRPGSNVANSISTNCFTIGSMAVDDLSPPIEVNGKKVSYGTNSKGERIKDTDVPYRIPKCALVDDKGKLLDPKFVNGDKKQEIADAFAGAFASTWDASNGNEADALPTYLTYKGGAGPNGRIPLEQVAMHSLLDWLDDDVYPGGTKGRNSETEADDYLPKYEWCHFPCVEPIPMLDNVLVLGTLEFDNFYFKKVTNESGQLVDGVATTAVWKVTISMPKNSSFRYVGWTVPEAAAGDYDSEWSFQGIGMEDDDFPENTSPDFKSAYTEALIELRDKLEGMKALKGTMHVSKGIHGNQRRGEFDDGDLETMFSFNLPMPMDTLPEDVRLAPKKDNPVHNRYEAIPDAVGMFLMAKGKVLRGSHLLQVAPAPRNNDPEDEHNYVRIPLILRKEEMTKGEEPAFLGGAYCLDPMFAYNFDSWIPTISLGLVDDNDPMSVLRKDISDEALAQRIVNLGDINPLTRLYLYDPNKNYGGRTLFQILSGNNKNGMRSAVGGGSDVMWANPSGIYDDGDGIDSDDAAASLAFYIDPKEDDETQPECFNRVGQLGFLPIGTYRTIALLDGFCDGKRVPRQRVLDYFTMHAPRDEGTEGTDEAHPGEPVKSALFTSRISLNPPRTVYWDKNKKAIESDDYNLLPMTAALSGCPLREWATTDKGRMLIPWALAEELASAYAENLDRKDNHAQDEDVIDGWNSDGVAHDLSILGRSGQYLANPSETDLKEDPSWDSILRQTKQGDVSPICDFDREGIVRNTAGMFTARQQIFTLLLKADSFTPKFGYERDAAHGTSLASVQAIVHVWRDPEPLRDAAGYPVRDRAGNAIHPYVVLDVYQF